VDVQVHGLLVGLPEGECVGPEAFVELGTFSQMVYKSVLYLDCLQQIGLILVIGGVHGQANLAGKCHYLVGLVEVVGNLN
jgi:hypothetical protein